MDAVMSKYGFPARSLPPASSGRLQEVTDDDENWDDDPDDRSQVQSNTNLGPAVNDAAENSAETGVKPADGGQPSADGLFVDPLILEKMPKPLSDLVKMAASPAVTSEMLLQAVQMAKSRASIKTGIHIRPDAEVKSVSVPSGSEKTPIGEEIQPDIETLSASTANPPDPENLRAIIAKAQQMLDIVTAGTSKEGGGKISKPSTSWCELLGAKRGSSPIEIADDDSARDLVIDEKPSEKIPENSSSSDCTLDFNDQIPPSGTIANQDEVRAEMPRLIPTTRGGRASQKRGSSLYAAIQK